MDVTTGARVVIPVCQIEFHVGGNTIWIHSPIGATVLRIKTMGKIEIDKCDMNPVSHTDLIVKDDINFCLAEDANNG